MLPIEMIIWTAVVGFTITMIALSRALVHVERVQKRSEDQLCKYLNEIEGKISKRLIEHSLEFHELKVHTGFFNEQSTTSGDGTGTEEATEAHCSGQDPFACSAASGQECQGPVQAVSGQRDDPYSHDRPVACGHLLKFRKTNEYNAPCGDVFVDPAVVSFIEHYSGRVIKLIVHGEKTFVYGDLEQVAGDIEGHICNIGTKRDPHEKTARP